MISPNHHPKAAKIQDPTFLFIPLTMWQSSLSCQLCCHDCCLLPTRQQGSALNERQMDLRQKQTAGKRITDNLRCFPTDRFAPTKMNLATAATDAPLGERSKNNVGSGDPVSFVFVSPFPLLLVGL